MRGRSEGHKGSSRSRRRTRWPNLLTAAIAYSAVKFTGAHVIGSNSDPQGGRPDDPPSQPSCEATKQQPQVIFQVTEAHTLVQLSDRGVGRFRIEIHRRSCDWPNFLTRKGVFQISLAGVALSKGRPQRIFQATEAHTLVQLSDRGDCLFRAEIHRRSCDWSNFLLSDRGDCLFRAEIHRRSCDWSN